jgi:cyanophycin synthetase
VLKMAGHVVGQTSTDAVYIDGNVTVKGDMTGPKSASMVLRDPMVDMRCWRRRGAGSCARGSGIASATWGRS